MSASPELLFNMLIRSLTSISAEKGIGYIKVRRGLEMRTGCNFLFTVLLEESQNSFFTTFLLTRFQIALTFPRMDPGAKWSGCSLKGLSLNSAYILKIRYNIFKVTPGSFIYEEFIKNMHDISVQFENQRHKLIKISVCFWCGKNKAKNKCRKMKNKLCHAALQ